MMSTMMTPKTLAAKLGVHENTLAKWRLQGVGPKFVKVQRHVRYADYDVEQWVEERKFSSTTEADEAEKFCIAGVYRAIR